MVLSVQFQVCQVVNYVGNYVVKIEVLVVWQEVLDEFGINVEDYCVEEQSYVECLFLVGIDYLVEYDCQKEKGNEVQYFVVNVVVEL